MKHWQAREKKLRKRRYGMRTDGANVRKLMLDLINRQNSPKVRGIDSHGTMVPDQQNPGETE